jgi:hypothetical protein
VTLRELIDDESILDTDLLYRRVSWQAAGGRQKYSPGECPPVKPNFFSDWPLPKAREAGFAGTCMSMGLVSIIESDGLGPEAMLERLSDQSTRAEYGVVELQVGDLRRLIRHNGEICHHGVMRAATIMEPWHVVAFDLSHPGRPEACKKALTRVSRYVIELG